jgi:hypothetical protein
VRAGQVQQSPGDLSHGGRGRRGLEEEREREREEKEEKREKDGEAVSESRGALVPRRKG